jgi:hypothetical protein
MVKRLLICVVFSGAIWSSFAADYFPVEPRNAWTFSYMSVSMPVIPNPTTTKDSGTVKWEIVENRNVEMVNIYTVNLKHSLVRRTMTLSDSSVKYDSVFSPPRITIDTVVLRERVDQTGIGFSNATCAFAVHDPTVAMPPELSSKDTTVSFDGSPVAGKKMVVSECSCLDAKYAYSFTLGPAIGPVEAYITTCPTLAGSSYRETWKLISREYPTYALSGNASPVVCRTVAVNQSSGRIHCSLNLAFPSPVHIGFFDVKGRLIKTLFTGKLNAGVYRYSWNLPVKTVGIALLRMRTGEESRCIKIITGVE